jgi:glyoxylase-like metal-dependent hydrolase (beta-lactamase superfamily II)
MPQTAAAALARIGIVSVLAVMPTSVGLSQTAPDLGEVDVQVLPVQGNIYMLVGAGGNSTLQVGDEGILIEDTQLAASSDRLLAAIRRISNKPIRYIVNTHVHPDHTGGNASLATAGSTIAGGNVVGDLGDEAGATAAVIAHETVLNRMSATPAEGQEPTPTEALPTDTYFTAGKELFFNGEAIEIRHLPAAHTDGDSLVFFRRSDVVSAGDVMDWTRYPIIDEQRGGSVNGIIAALNTILDVTIPGDKQEGGTMVIPGHGRLCDEADVVEYRDMVTIIRDRVQDMRNRGMTLAQVQAARPTRDYDRRFGADTGFWTTDMFVAAVYRTLGPKP